MFKRYLRMGSVAAILWTGGLEGRAGEQAMSNTLYQTGAERYEKKDYAGAADMFLKAVASEPKNAECQRMAGLCHRRMGDDKRALDCLRKAVESDPNGIPGQYARHTVAEIESGLKEPSAMELGPAYFPGYYGPSDGERYYRPRIERLPDLAGTPVGGKVKDLKNTLLDVRFRLAAAPDDLEKNRAELNELRTGLTPVQVLEAQTKEIEGAVQAWAKALLTLADLYAQAGNTAAAAETMAILQESPFMRRARPEIITELPAYQAAIKQSRGPAK